MAKILYYLGLKLYGFAIWLASFFIEKAKLTYTGRQESWGVLENFSKTNSRTVIWFHCASLGEFEQGRPVIEACKQRFPEIAIALTFFSPSGYEIRKKYQHADLITYLPGDSPKNAHKFYELLQPKMAIFVKYEFWHYYIATMKKNGVNTICISSIFIPENSIFKPESSFFRKMVGSLNHLFLQDNQSKKLLEDIGIEQTTVSGDTRFDRVKEIESKKKKIEIAEQFTHNAFCLVIGSCWPHDLEVIAPTLEHFSKPLKIIIAPHEIAELSLKKIESFFTRKKTIRFSVFNSNAQADILIIDNIGMLSSLYQYANIAYIGGAFGKGLHNTLEAAVYGIPVVFGENYRKFKEAIDLVALKAAFSVKSEADFTEIFHKLYDEKALREDAGKKASNFVNNKTGATQQILDYIVKYLQINA